MHGQTIKYNAKTRLGRGFTLVELKVCAAAECLVCMLLSPLAFTCVATQPSSALLHRTAGRQVPGRLVIAMRWQHAAGGCMQRGSFAGRR